MTSAARAPARSAVGGRGGLRPGASWARVLALAVTVPTAALGGCATIVLGPRDSTNPLAFVTEAVAAQQPVELGQGPASGLGALYQETLYRSIESACAAATLTPGKWRNVYVHGWGPPRPAAVRNARARAQGRSPWPAVVRAAERLVAHEVADRLLRLRVPVTDDPGAAELWLLPWVPWSGGSTTERVYRFYQYPVYYHYEDHRSSAVSLLLYDIRQKKVIDVSSVRSRRIAVDSYLLDIFGFRFEF